MDEQAAKNQWPTLEDIRQVVREELRAVLHANSKQFSQNCPCLSCQAEIQRLQNTQAHMAARASGSGLL